MATSAEKSLLCSLDEAKTMMTSKLRLLIHAKSLLQANVEHITYEEIINYKNYAICRHLNVKIPPDPQLIALTLFVTFKSLVTL